MPLRFLPQLLLMQHSHASVLNVICVQVATQLLKHSQGQNEQCRGIMRALSAASQAALAVNSATAANISEALFAAESGVAGLFPTLLPTEAMSYTQLSQCQFRQLGSDVVNIHAHVAHSF